MKANELMIGDWVQNSNHDVIGKVILINTQPDLMHYQHRAATIQAVYPAGNILCHCKESLLEPIPLTFEIMEKNGFVKVPHEYEYPECQCWTNDVDGSYSFEIVADEHRKPYILGNGDMGDYEWVNFECKYVHELQHALRLAGIKKEIVL